WFRQQTASPLPAPLAGCCRVSSHEFRNLSLHTQLPLPPKSPAGWISPLPRRVLFPQCSLQGAPLKRRTQSCQNPLARPLRLSPANACDRHSEKCPTAFLPAGFQPTLPPAALPEIPSRSLTLPSPVAHPIRSPPRQRPSIPLAPRN